MKAVVLAGGKGTRMKPLTHTRSKHLLKVANKPILIHSLEYLKKCGVDKFLVITSNEAYDAVYDTLENNDPVEVDNVIIQYEPKGIAHALALAEDWVDGEDFVLYLGDNLFEDVVSFAPGGNKIYLKEVDNPKRFGVARFLDERGILLEVVEKPHNPPSNYAVTGMYCFTSNVFSHIDSLQYSSRGELEITDLINILIKEGFFDHEILNGWWLDTGKKDSLLEANQKLLEQISGCIETEDYIYVGEGYYKLIEKSGSSSRLIGPCIVSKKANVSESEVGPNVSIDHNTGVTKSVIRNSIIGEECSIYNKFLDYSILGSNVRICSVDEQRTKSIVIVGDDSEVIC